MTPTGGANANATEVEGELRAIAVDRDSIYVIDRQTRVVRLPKAGGAPETLHPPEAVIQYPGGLVVDDGFLYWTTLGFGDRAGRVVRMPKTGGPVDVIADNQPRPWGLAIDDDHVYWANEGVLPPKPGEDYTEGSIARARKAGGQVEILTAQRRAMAIALDADTVYFATGPSGGENGTIARVSKQGGESRVLVERRNTILSMAVDDGRVVWSENGNLAAAVSSDGGPVVELHRRDDPGQVAALVSQGIAAAGGSVYFGVGRQNAALRASARDGSSRDVETMTLPSNANAFIATSIAVDEARVYWFDYWWSYSSPKHQAIVRSTAR